MNGLVVFLVLGLAFPTAYMMTGLMRRYALVWGILDVPNARSSHSVPTPRGGGVAVAVVTLVGGLVLGLVGVVPRTVVMALCGGGVLVAGIGWLDDRHSLSPAVRAAVHVVAASWALWWLGGLPQVRLGEWQIPLGPLGWPLALPGVVWLINLYNFMDGIDGLAGMEAVMVGAVGGVLEALTGNPGLAFVSFLVALASLGFLLWNWPPAKIFMGDVGSGFIGFVLAVLAISSENLAALPAVIWLVLLGVFLTDATATLIVRMFRGEQWYRPHRSHVYQLAVRAGHSHRQVTLTVLGLNVLLAAGAAVEWRWPASTLWVELPAAGVLVLGYLLLLRHYGPVVPEHGTVHRKTRVIDSGTS